MPVPPPSRAAAHLTALKAAITYLMVAILWMVFTDQLLMALIDTVVPLSRAQLFKNISFVLLTTGLIYGLVFRIIWTVSQAQRQAWESQERYQALFNGSEDPVFVYLLDERGQPDTFTELNDRACSRLRYPRNALLSKSLRDIVPPDALPQQRLHLDALVKNGRALLETELVRSDGVRVPFEINAQGFELDGRLTIVAVARDLTRRKDAERAVQDSERRYRLLAENASDIIWTADLAGRLSYISPSVERLLGYSPEDLSTKFGELILTEDSQSRLTGATHTLMRQTPATPIRVELEVVHRDQSTRWLEADLSLLKSPNGAFIGIQGVGRDIHARKLAEQEQRRIQGQLLQAQKMDAIGTLAGGIAHDLNNLLVIMLGNVEMAQLGDPGPLARYLGQIQRAAERAADLVRKLLLFSRQQPISIHPIDFNEALTSILEMLDRLLGERIAVETALARDLWTVSADRGQLEQVMINLAVNARDAMSGGGTLTIQTDNLVWPGDNSLQAGNYIRLRVTDTGEGMDRATIARIFEPFFTTKDIGAGTGLGLSTAYGIVQEHGGLIQVESALAAGSTFTVLLPATPMTVPVEIPRFGPPSVPIPRSLLLVEDEDQVREFMTQALTEFGYTVVGADSITQARERLAAPNDFELVISDVILPDGNGPALLRSLLKEAPDMPVLLISGHTGKIIEEQFGDSPPRLLRKPFTLAQLFEALQEVISTTR
ncbi:MAG: two-component system cell cycle sensor histidine kinase/response regulator CckA [Myxococcota bacterium]|jgi:two-component system cell cycle sensor histidine kinase/response regulator CckA